METSQVQYGGTTIAFTVTRTSRRRKTVALTVDGEAGLAVAAPMGVPLDEIRAIVRRRAAWVLRNATISSPKAYPGRFVSGSSVAYLGRRVRLTVVEAETSRAVVQFRHWGFTVTVPKELDTGARPVAIRRALVRWYRGRAQARLQAKVEYWARILGHSPSGVLIRDQRQRWASCSAEGIVRFNWRVVMAEPSLIDYIVLHELMHLDVKNHSAEFWGRLAVLMPDYLVRRRRLREVGPYLSL